MTTAWTDAGAYERSMGRWSLILNRAFVPWLGVGPGAAWVDIGCGTGSLSAVLLEMASPGSITGVDPSADFVAAARRRLPGARFEVAAAERLPFADAAFDVAAASLCFHVMPDPAGAAKEMRRVLRPGGAAGASVWPATAGMEVVSRLLQAAAELGLPPRPKLSAMREPVSLMDVFESAGFREVEFGELLITTAFESFDDLWDPFTQGPGTTQDYVRSLSPDGRDALRARLAATLPVSPDGSIPLPARAIAVKGRA